MWNKDTIAASSLPQMCPVVILSNPIGSGLYVWKPYILLQTLHKIKDGDFIVYNDCSRNHISGFTTSVAPIINHMISYDVDMVSGPLLTSVKNWEVVRDGVITMIVDELNGASSEPDIQIDKVSNHGHFQTAPMILRKTEATLKFVTTWLQYCIKPECIIPDDIIPNLTSNETINPGEYQGHIFDQAVYSCVLTHSKLANTIKVIYDTCGDLYKAKDMNYIWSNIVDKHLKVI